MRGKSFQQITSNITFIKELFRNQMTLFQEPYKNQTGDKSNGSFVIIFCFISIIIDVIREANNLNSPSVPIAQLIIEFFSKNLYREAAV